ncbi:MAG: HlyD family efflux transporter periplasmic adaptor subunit [Bacteroidales bacterium]
MNRTTISCIIGILLSGCGNNEQAADAYGNFEAVDVLVSAEGQGKLLSFDIEEGERLSVGKTVAVIDTIQLHLQKEQIRASLNVVRSNYVTVEAQSASYRVQLDNLDRELKRIENLLTDGAATGKQRDDILGNMALVKSQRSALQAQKATISAEEHTLLVQVRQIENQIQKSMTINPIDGLVLEKYRQSGEIVAPGQALYKIADTDQLILRAYISGDQLSGVKVGDQVIVRYDGPSGIAETKGTVSWIASQAEFTPKIIQTREERVNLVYAMKVIVVNDGSLKIGMPGEVKFR